MSLKTLILVSIVFCSCHCLSQSVGKKVNTSSRNIFYVSFFVDGKEKKIDNRFSFTIVHHDDTIKAKIKGHSILVPEIKDLLDYSIIFKYREYSLSFNRISKKMLFPAQNHTWEFGIDNRPFDESMDLMTSQEYENDKTTRQLQYLRIQPMEFGDGLRFINKIIYNKSK
ncbi:hypothetical protein FAM09_14735 [Niastella caeni]|uniref:Uncharacterized protein n=1 Tax=Niastella caeni TaxID=2569763 RepID=A0A4S8HVT1_9BACT|nr:hypothetical protein [Niastella caeni]THU39747.1 hypothetical protein FAM09_14735 [Niastella caeni]